MRKLLIKKNVILSILFIMCIIFAVVVKNFTHSINFNANCIADTTCRIYFSNTSNIGKQSEKIEFKISKGETYVSKKIPLRAKYIYFDFGTYHTEMNISHITVDNIKVSLSNIEKSPTVTINNNSMSEGGGSALINGRNSYIKILDSIDSWKDYAFKYKLISYFLSALLFVILLYTNKFSLHINNTKLSKKVYYIIIFAYASIYMLIKFRISRSVIHFSEDTLYKYIASLKHELIIVAIAILILLALVATRKKIIMYICTLLLFLITSIYIVDICVYYELDNRLIFDKIPLWLNSIGGGSPIVMDFLGHSFGIMSVLLLGIVWLAYRFAQKNIFFSTRYDFLFCAVLIASAYAFHISNLASSVVESRLYNVYTVNDTNQNKAYSESYKYKQGLAINYKHQNTNITKNKNVILLIVESYSSSISKLISGCNDYTPLTDVYSSDAYIFKNYATNGGHTTAAIFSILTGHPFLHGKNSMYQKEFYDNSFLHLFKKRGYKTSIFHPAISVGGFDAFLDLLPFDIISLDTDKKYNDQKRFVFNSVTDKILLNNVYEYVSTEKNPYLSIIVTTTMHAPFLDPMGTELRSFENNARFTDSAIADFIQKLQKSNFFENGILVITADHHAMIPLNKKELDKYGDTAITRVPLIIFDKNMGKGVNESWFDHCSLGALIQLQALGEYIINQFQIDPIAFNDKPILHQFISPADTVNVVNRKGGILKLDGDDTEFSFSFPDEEEYYRYIYWLRTHR